MTLREKDIPVWLASKPFLDVRNNDEHTLIAYLLAQKLLDKCPEADPEIVLPALLFHDTGWKMIPPEKLLQAFGPDNKYPELTRRHELEGAALAEKALGALGFSADAVARIAALIDGHDTTKEARSPDDAVLKDADKLWRYTPHGQTTIRGWFDWSPAKVLDVLENYVLPGFLTEPGREAAALLLEVSKAEHDFSKYI